MIAPWMLYSVGIASLLGVAALAAERALLAARLPTRWTWVLALAGSLLLPAALSWAPTSGVMQRAGSSIVAPAAAGMEMIPAVVASPSSLQRTSPLDRGLGLAWLLSSALAAGVVMLSIRSLERQRRGWRYRLVSGRPVWISSRTGPAVLGFFWPEIVLPEWALHWDAESQRLLLAHEAEHEEAGDPFLLLLALLALVVMPWSAPMWWQLRRLRAAIEVDCDERVLRRERSPAAYGRLLIEVGRLSSRRLMPVTAFAESPSLLERRIRLIAGAAKSTHPGVRVALWGCALLPALAVQSLPAPQRPDLGTLWSPSAVPTHAPVRGQSSGGKPDPAVLQLGREPTFTPYDLRPELRNAGELARAVAALRAKHGQDLLPASAAHVLAFVDRAGAVRNVHLARSSGDRSFDLIAQSALLTTARFTPARDDARATPAWIEVPIAAADTPVEVYRIPLATTPPPPPPGDPSDSQPGAAVDEQPPRLLDPGAVERRLATSAASGEGGSPSGGAELWVYVDAAGVPRDLRLATSSGDRRFDLVAGEALRRSRFAPASRDGHPVATWTRVPLRPE